MKIYIKLSDFERKYIRSHKYMSLIPVQVMMEYNSAFIGGEKFMQIDSDFDVQLQNEYQSRVAQEKLYKRLSDLRTKGMAVEKDGNMDKAIEIYSKCIEEGESAPISMFTAFSYAYERIIILLRKTGQIDKETQYIRRYLAHSELPGNKWGEYHQRLQKLINKK